MRTVTLLIFSVICTVAEAKSTVVQGRLPNGQPVIIIRECPPPPRPIIVVKPRPLTPEVKRAMQGYSLNPNYREPDATKSRPLIIVNPYAEWRGQQPQPQLEDNQGQYKGYR